MNVPITPVDIAARRVEEWRSGGVGEKGNQRPVVDKTQQPGYAAAKAEYAAKRDKLEKTTQDFEAVFVGMMLKQMRKSVAGQNALFGNSPEAKMYQDMMDDATAQHMSKVGTFGLAKVLFKTMSPSLPPDPDKS